MTDGRADDQAGDPQRVLVLVDRGANREQLAGYLSERFEVVIGADTGVEAALEEFDLCLVDAVSFDRHRSELAAGKDDANPVFLPYLLILPRGEPGDLDRETWAAVDDVVATPIARNELRCRIEALLRTRRYSVDLLRQNERLARFADIVSHDLRNPLSIARGYLVQSREQYDPAPLERVDRALTRMQEIVDDLLTLARKGAVVESIERVQLAGAVGAAWDTVNSHDADLEVAVTPGTTIRADESRLITLLENLLQNAVDHAGPGASIRVGLLDEAVGFHVEDDGPGIPEGDRDAIFEYGHTASDAGTGFGLAIAQAIVAAHGWSIRLSDHETGGARFEVTGDIELSIGKTSDGSTTSDNPIG